MSDLVEFLRARLDDIEQVALAAKNGARGEWRQDDPERYPGAIRGDDGVVVTYDESSPNEEQAAHIVLHDPASVLADVAAKRRIVDWAEALLQTLPSDPGAALMFEQAGDALLRLLAQPFADHPDFDPAWKVG